MSIRFRALSLLAGTLIAASLAGCGSGGDPASADPGLDPSTGGYTDPSTGTTGTSPYIAPTPMPTPAPILQDITATVTTKKNGVFLGLGAYKCTVEVTNPNSVARTGTLTVTFMAGSKQSATAPATQTLSLGPNETKDFDFSDPKWTTNDVQINVTSDPAQGATTSSYGATYGQATSPYGS